VQEHEYEFEVALSFATEDRPYVEEVYRGLTALGIKTFYDKSVQESLWSNSVGEYLDNVFGARTRFCVVFLSKDYFQKSWTKRELKAAQARREIREHEHFLLPVRFDDTPIDGIDPDLGYLRAKDYRPRELANKIAEKLGLSIHQRQLDVRSHAFANPLCIRFTTPLDIDLDLLIESLRPFLRWAQENAFCIPCEVIFPKDLNVYFNKVVAETPQKDEGAWEHDTRRDKFFANGLNLLTQRIAEGVRAAVFTVVGIRNNRFAEKDISDVELRTVVATYVAATAANFIFDVMKWRVAHIQPPTWLPQFYEVSGDLGETFYRGLAFVLKNTADELLFWTNAELYYEDGFRVTKHVYVPSRMLLSGHRDTPTREHFLKFIVPQLIELALHNASDKFNTAALQTYCTYPERLRIYPQGKWFIELEHFEQLSNSDSDLRHLRKNVQLTMRDLVQRGQFREVEAIYQDYEPAEREQVVFEHIMIALDSVLQSH
jgi:hypothetical protein